MRLVKCPVCNKEFDPDAGDCLYLLAESVLPDDEEVSVRCPNCGTYLPIPKQASK